MGNTKIVAIVLLLVMNIFLGVASAAPIQEWSKRFAEGNDAFSVDQTFYGGYIFAGRTSSSDALLMKVDASGNKQWSKTLRATDETGIATSVRETSDKGYVVTGFGDPNTGVFTGWLIKTDQSGNKKWEKVFERVHDVQLYSVIQTKDGGYAVVGQADEYPDYYSWFSKTDSSGNEQWKGIIDLNRARDIVQTRDGGYIVAGSVGYKAAISKTDSSGVQQWTKIFPDTDISIAMSVLQTNDGGYIITGDDNSYYAHLIKTDASGNKQWSKMYRVGSGWLLSNAVYSVQQDKDGGYIIGGRAEYDDYVSNWWKGVLIKTDSRGNKQWSMELGKEIKSVKVTKDGGYIVAGNDQSKAFVAKLGSDSPLNVNILKNPGFETVSGSLPQYWSKSQTGIKAVFTYPTIGRVGGKAIAIRYAIKETGKVALWQQTGIAVVPSKQYKLSGYMKLEGVTGGGTLPRYNGAGIRVNWYTSTGTLIRTDVITKSGTIGWAKYEKIFTAPPNAVKANVGGDLFNAAGKVTFDDLSFVKIS